MWAYFNNQGQLLKSIEHGQHPSAGTTNFSIFAFFKDITDVTGAALGTATIRLYRPDLTDSGYVSFIMEIVEEPFALVGSETTESVAPFQDGQTYKGYKFSFGTFTDGQGQAQDVTVLLDTPGLWTAVITLRDVQSARNVQGSITFNVFDGVNQADPSEVSTEQLYEAILDALGTKMNKTDTLCIKRVTSWPASTFSSETFSSGDLVLRDDSSTEAGNLYQLGSTLAVSAAVLKFKMPKESWSQVFSGVKRFVNGVYVGTTDLRNGIVEANGALAVISNSTNMIWFPYGNDKSIRPFDGNVSNLINLGRPDRKFKSIYLSDSIYISSLAAIGKTTISGTDYLSFSTNNVYVGGEFYVEDEADFATDVWVEGDLRIDGELTDGSITMHLSDIVLTSGNQTLAGLKKFTTCPETSGAIYYSNNNQLTNKSYVDAKISEVNNAISAEAGARQLTDTYLSNQIGYINEKIPSQATSSNKLADKDWVNSTINSLAAFYITKNAAGDPFSTRAELMAATTFYSGGEVRVPTRNDYCLVNADETHDNASCRYIYQGGQWEFQFIVNETAFTAAQLAALNSGINATLVGQITTNQNAITALDTTKLSKTEAQSTYQKKNIVGDVTIAVADWTQSGSYYYINVSASTGLSNPMTIEDGDTFIYVGIESLDKATLGDNGIVCTSDETNQRFVITAMQLPERQLSLRILQIK